MFLTSLKGIPTQDFFDTEIMLQKASKKLEKKPKTLSL